MKKDDDTQNGKEARELALFMREHGMVSIEERTADIFKALNKEEKKRFLENEKELVPFEYAITHTKRVRRLNGLFQLGGRQIPNESPAGNVMAIPAFHTRFNHSEAAALYIKIVGARLNLPIEKIKNSLAAAWLHDVGHSAFSHAGDELLVERGFPSHEERGIEVLEKDEELKKVLFGRDIKEVVRIIREENAAGELQSAIDTISYLDMDASMLKIQKQIDVAFLLKDIQAFDEKKKALVVLHPEIWKKMLEARIGMMSGFYHNRRNQISGEALRQLMRIALDEKEMDADELALGNDYDIRLALQNMVHFDPYKTLRLGLRPKAPKLRAFKDLYTLYVGFELDNWQEIECDSRKEAEAIIQSQKPEIRKSSFIVAPYDYTKKTLRIIDAKDPSKKVQLIRGKKGLSSEERKYIVCFKKG